MAPGQPDWRMGRKNTMRGGFDKEKTSTFVGDSTTLAWLDSFVSKKIGSDDASLKNLEGVFPWLWNLSWCDTIGVDSDGAKHLKNAVRHAESMVLSLGSLFHCAKSRLELLQTRLNTLAAKANFHRLSDDNLASIFRYASLPNVRDASEGKSDYKVAGRISLVCRRFRKIALRVPSLWRFIHSAQSEADVELLLSRSINAGAIVELHFDSEGKGDWHWLYHEMLSRVGQDKAFASRIVCLHFDFCRNSVYYDIEEFAKEDCYKDLSFPFLLELSINFDYGRTGSDVQFCETWKMPALKVLRTRNFIPTLRGKVLPGITECSLHFEGEEDDNEPCWEYDEVLALIKSLRGLKRLDLTLNGNAFKNDPKNDCYTTRIASRTIAHARTAFPETDHHAVQMFLRAFKTPEKSSWTLEVDSDDVPLRDILAQSVDGTSQAGNSKLEEFNFVVLEKQASGGVDCNHLRTLSDHAPGLDRYSISYLAPRKIEYAKCKGRIEEVLAHAEEEASCDPEKQNLRLVFDGSDASG